MRRKAALPAQAYKPIERPATFTPIAAGRVAIVVPEVSMNVKLCSLLILVAAVSLPGCRTTDSSARYVPTLAQAVPGSTYEPRIEENAEYVAYVQSVARRRGVTVRWVNKPVKRHADQQ